MWKGASGKDSSIPGDFTYKDGDIEAMPVDLSKFRKNEGFDRILKLAGLNK